MSTSSLATDKQSAKPIPVSQPAQAQQDEAEAVESGGNRFLMFQAAPGWLVSMIFHAVLIILLALIALPEPKREIMRLLALQPEQIDEAMEDFEFQDFTPQDQQELENIETLDQVVTPEDVSDLVNETNLLDNFEDPLQGFDVPNFSEQHAPAQDLIGNIGMVANSALVGRSGAKRSAMVKRFGGTEASETAVAMALKWLADHQLPDGGWNFDHTQGRGGPRDHAGRATMARNGATALALLPFLGAGQTHQEGQYKEVVRKGLAYLISHQKSAGREVGSFHEPQGHMYSHGLCAIVLTEAYALTKDKDLLTPAQAALDFITAAQDPIGGGWRYDPRQAGDTSVVGWQLMALKSGHMAYLRVPPNTLRGAVKFLDSVQIESGSKYGYVSPGDGYATTAIGLLSRMYLGWERSHAPLERGVKYLAERGPSTNKDVRGNIRVTQGVDMYYNYYATQVMRHYEGPLWEEWNTEMRDWLVETQNKKGKFKGSWSFADPWATSGGRLYCTALGAMILEVYYRHMPIYGQKAATDKFPL